MANQPPESRRTASHNPLGALESLVATTQDAVVFIDVEARITHFNHAAEVVFGYEVKEVLGENVTILMPSPWREEHDGYVENYRTTGERRAIGRIRTVQGQRKDGEAFPIELSVTEFSAAGATYYAAFIRDISEKVHLQSEVAEKKRLASIGATAAALAHEVGNPLNNMRLQAQLATRKLRGMGLSEGGVTSNLRTISDEIERLSDLLEEFRSLARRQGLRVSDTDLEALIRQVCESHQAAVIRQGIVVEHEISDGLPSIRADAAKLKQVLLNLCKNAIEAMPHGGDLTVSAVQDGEMVQIDVTDTGGGVKNEADAFEPFHTTKDKGTGLGLPIARRIALAHGGTIGFESEAGVGTTFRLTLPLGGPPVAEPTVGS